MKYKTKNGDGNIDVEVPESFYEKLKQTIPNISWKLKIVADMYNVSRVQIRGCSSERGHCPVTATLENPWPPYWMTIASAADDTDTHDKNVRSKLLTTLGLTE